MHNCQMEYELDEKKNRRGVIVLMIVTLFIIFLGVPFASLCFEIFMYTRQIQNGLEAYRPMVDYINEYKDINNLYPDNVTNLKIVSKELPYFVYKTYNNKTDFILFVSKYEHQPEPPYIGHYRYCSTINLDGCTPLYESENKIIEYYNLGTWIGTYYND